MTPIYDISPPVSPDIAVFPGDSPFRREVAMDFERGDHLVLSAISTTVHVGAHADAPSHYTASGQTIDARPLELYLGPCQVVTVDSDGPPRILASELPSTLTDPRIVVRTGSYPDPDRWTPDFRAFSVEAVDHLAAAGAILIGIDTPSVDPANDRILEAHAAVARRDLALLEGLVLNGVPDGRYTLVALPLRLRGADASPVRAVLLPPLPRE